MSALAWLCAAAACGGGTSAPVSDDPIDRETFIDAYVELRAAAVGTEGFAVTDEERDRILESHGVDGEELLRFADAHGRDVEFMREVWNEVETRLDERTTVEDRR